MIAWREYGWALRRADGAPTAGTPTPRSRCLAMAKRADPYSLWIETAAAMNAAVMTMAIRLFRMQQSMVFGDVSGGPEAKAMVAEKWTAAYRGYWRGIEAMTRFALAPPASAAAMQDAMFSIGSAMVAPSRQRVRANARRLTRIR